MNTKRSLVRALALAAFCLVNAACVPQYEDFDAFIKTPTPPAAGKPYVIEPPDRLQILAPSAPELHEQQLTLRPDGYITLPLLGELFAAGKTPTQLAAEVEEGSLRFYKDVSVQVQVTQFNSKRYYLAGEISQGPRRYTGNDRILDAVLSAGVTRTAWPENLVVLRPNEQGELIRRMTIDFNDMTQKGDLRYNAVLEEGDIIFMPINPLAAVGVAVQNLLSPIDPLINAARTPSRAVAAGSI